MLDGPAKSTRTNREMRVGRIPYPRFLEEHRSPTFKRALEHCFGEAQSPKCIYSHNRKTVTLSCYMNRAPMPRIR